MPKKLPKNSKTRETVRVWLEKHITIQKKLAPYPLPISSDIIESLFGKFKYRLVSLFLNKTNKKAI